jgi:leucine dehydrogenase
MFEHPDFDDHEQVVVASDRQTGLRALVAIHSTARGPAFGGCRMRMYRDERDALADVLRLARGMTFKATICNLPLGGGKSVIIGDPERDKTPELLHAMGRLIDSWNGRYIVADDVGTTLADLAIMRRATAHTAAATAAAQQPLAATAYGVLMAIRAAVRHRLGVKGLAGLRVAVQGLGNVGFPLCGYLQREGAFLVVSDLSPTRVRQAGSAFGALGVDAAAIFDQAVDVFAPCALGGILNPGTVPRLRAQIVCGGANDQLDAPGTDAALAMRGILFIPDYIAGAGGVIDFHQERIDDRPEAVLRAVGRIESITSEVLRAAAASGRTPKQVADDIVRQRLAAARRQHAA